MHILKITHSMIFEILWILMKRAIHIIFIEIPPKTLGLATLGRKDIAHPWRHTEGGEVL